MSNQIDHSSLLIGRPSALQTYHWAKAAQCLQTGKTNFVQNTEIPMLFLSEILLVVWVLLCFH